MVSITVRREVLEGSEALFRYFASEFYLSNVQVTLTFPYDPLIAFEIVLQYLSSEPEPIAIQHLKKKVMILRIAERVPALLRLYRLANGLRLWRLCILAIEVLVQFEEQIAGPNILTIARIVFGRNNGFQTLFPLKKWCIKLIAQHYEYLRTSIEWRKLLTTAAPVLYQKWVRLRWLMIQGANPIGIAYDQFLDDYDKHNIALNGTFAPGTHANYNAPAHFLTYINDEDTDDDAAQHQSGPNHTATKHLNRSSPNGQENGEEKEANKRAVSALEDSVTKFNLETVISQDTRHALLMHDKGRQQLLQLGASPKPSLKDSINPSHYPVSYFYSKPEKATALKLSDDDTAQGDGPIGIPGSSRSPNSAQMSEPPKTNGNGSGLKGQNSSTEVDVSSSSYLPQVPAGNPAIRTLNLLDLGLSTLPEESEDEETFEIEGRMTSDQPSQLPLLPMPMILTNGFEEALIGNQEMNPTHPGFGDPASFGLGNENAKARAVMGIDQQHLISPSHHAGEAAQHYHRLKSKKNRTSFFGRKARIT